MDRSIKILLAKPGLDGHDVGAKIVVRALMDAGFDVAYSGKTGEHKSFFKVNRDLKHRFGDKLFTVMGGPHPTFNHSKIRLFGEGGRDFSEVSDLDTLCVGEADDAWVEMLGTALGDKREAMPPLRREKRATKSVCVCV